MPKASSFNACGLIKGSKSPLYNNITYIFLTIGRPRKKKDPENIVSSDTDHVEVNNGLQGPNVADNPEERVCLEDGELRQPSDAVILEDVAKQTSGVDVDDHPCQKQNSNQQIQPKSQDSQSQPKRHFGHLKSKRLLISTCPQ